MRRLISTVTAFFAASTIATTAAAQADPFCEVRELGSLAIDGGFEIEVEGRYAYIRGVEVLHIIDVSDAANPQLMSTTDANGLVAFDVVGTTLYAARFFGGFLDIYDVADPTSPQLLSSFPLAGPEYIEVVGDIAYVGSYQTSILHVIDVNDPANPFERSSIRLGQGIGELIIQWPTAYLSNLDNLITVDLTDPDAPRELDRFGDDTNLRAVAGSLAFLQEIDGGTRKYKIVHVGRPDALRFYREGVFDTIRYSGPWSIVGDRLFTNGSGRRGVAIHDFTDPLRPRTMTQIATTGNAVAFQVVDQRLYSISRGGFQVFDIGGCPPYPFCLVDLNDDGVANHFDLQAFTNFYTAGKLQADFDNDGVLTPADIVVFQSKLADGCP